MLNKPLYKGGRESILMGRKREFGNFMIKMGICGINSDGLILLLGGQANIKMI